MADNDSRPLDLFAGLARAVPKIGNAEMSKLSTIDRMRVAVFESNAALGEAAAEDFADITRRTVAERGEISVIFATGNSQLSFLHALRDRPGVPWEHIIAFHMDEYLGLSEDHPASFRRFLHDKVSVFLPRAIYAHPRGYSGPRSRACEVRGGDRIPQTRPLRSRHRRKRSPRV